MTKSGLLAINDSTEKKPALASGRLGDIQNGLLSKLWPKSATLTKIGL
jgi:hypothetical protein